jgi:crotonobetaine/carnitine-CoA ligase
MMTELAGKSLHQLFSASVERAPQRTFLAMEEGRLSFREADSWSQTVAGGLLANGVTAGDVIALIGSNRLEVVVTWLACLRMGACFAPLNVGFTTSQLSQIFQRLSPVAVVSEEQHAATVDAALDETGTHPHRYVLRGTRKKWHEWSDLEGSDSAPIATTVKSSDLAAVLCTSGTTGVSKAVGLSNRWFTKLCESNERYWGFQGSDVFYCPFPLYHMDAMAMTVAPAMYHSTTAAIARRFSVKGFWNDIRNYEATVFDFLGTTLSLLWTEPSQPGDHDNPARLGWGVPMPDFQAAFEERFGCVLIDCYGSTDVGIPVYGVPGQAKPRGSCGQAIESYDLAILDQDGNEVSEGESGEIAVRPLEPNIIMEGYVGAPAATLDTWRGLWHHTGDVGKLDSDGYLYFLGRIQEYIRRRGENISVLELENEVSRHPDLVAYAAIGVPSELTEEDIKLVAVPHASSKLTPEDLGSWLKAHLPRYMTVRYIELVSALPTTETAKVLRRDLAANWRNPSTWDLDTNSYLSKNDR